MGTKKKEIQREAEALKKAGFELVAPLDEYSSQPDSGSVIGGERGITEYGIAGGIATEDLRRTGGLLDGKPVEDLDPNAIGISEFSEQMSRPVDELNLDRDGASETLELSDPELCELIRNRFKAHRAIRDEQIEINVARHGSVRLEGTVGSDALKLRLEELVLAIPGVRHVENNVGVNWSSA